MRGSRALIGLIDLATSQTIVADFYEIAPPDTAAISSRLVLPNGEATAEALTEMTSGESLEVAAQQLADGGADVIAFACTTGSLVKGVGWDRTLCERMQSRTDVKATTTSTAVLAALAAVGAKNIGVATPYISELDELERSFFERQGFTVVNIKGMGLLYDRDIGAQTPESAYQIARDVDGSAVDCIFISCTNLDAVPIIQRLEDDTGKPVVTSNQATIWHALRCAGVDDRIKGFGRLLADS